MPDLSPSSCPPPTESGSSGGNSLRVRLTINPPIPCGPKILWPLILIIVIPGCVRLVHSLPKPWAASTCMRIPRSWAIEATCETGCTTPVSLFTCIKDTNKVSCLNSRSIPSASTTPSEFGWTRLISNPSERMRSSGSRTALCSMAELITCILPTRLPCAANPLIAMLLLSVAPLVNTTSCRFTPTTRPILSRA